MRLSIGICIIILTLLACSPKVAVPTQADADRASTQYTDLSLEELRQGREVYIANCDLCHGLKKPSLWTVSKWEEILPKMIGGVEKKGRTLSEQETQALERYVHAMARE